ncbi:protein artemis-like [Zerene cesonia]|uniref:protein artemis-like n=1 Tax=Zerene cesonia TaxID=33412 RepID=UPI0018E5A8F6|nr:protein artemis-like [Zerene cesonia]
MYQRSIGSAFNGKIQEIPGVWVDNFENVTSAKPRAYFLSHCHSDHMQGLHSITLLDYLTKHNVYIYTTDLSAAIIDDEKRDPRIMEYVKVLKLGSSLITLPSIEDEAEILVTVTLIPAGHSAGAVMFLFQTVSYTVLFTGDFRINTSDVRKYAALHANGVPIKINAMYVDTTFIDYAYEDFPKRSESVDVLLRELDQWLNNGTVNRGVALHTSAKYGYEFVFNEIYKRLGVKVYVDEDRWKFYRLIPHLVPGVTNDSKHTKIHLCTKRTENNHITCIPNNYPQFLYVHLSAMKWTNYSPNLKSVVHVTQTRMDVCFATHCSRSELMYFVNYFSPDKIVGFPNPFVDRRGVKRKIVKACDGQTEIREKKLDKGLLKEIFG